MECPPGCPVTIYNLMRECWRWEPDRRPDFRQMHYDMENMFQESSITDEVEAQLRPVRGAQPAQHTPVMPTKKSRNNSHSRETDPSPSPRDHATRGLAIPGSVLAPQAAIMTNKSTVVQLRRGTNKQGRQAP